RSRRRRSAPRHCRDLRRRRPRAQPTGRDLRRCGSGRVRMAAMSGIEPIDLFAFAILLVAALRGMALGLIREVFSFGALAAAVIAVRVWNAEFAHWLQRTSGGALPQYLVPWLSGALLVVAVIAAVGTFGYVMRQGARAAGLGFFDRLGGAVIGVAEGAIAA